MFRCLWTPFLRFGIDANLQATELLAELHDELKKSGYPEHDMREWLTRILFCLFADDAEVWDRRLFETFIESRTAENGSDLRRHNERRIGDFLATVHTKAEKPLEQRSRACGAPRRRLRRARR